MLLQPGQPMMLPCSHAIPLRAPTVSAESYDRYKRSSKGISMQDLHVLGARAAALLIQRRETVVVGETSAGGLISASLLAIPGASAYFVGGAVTYSGRSIRNLAGISIDKMRADGIRSSSEPYALLLATEIRARHGQVDWGLSETGAAGPDGNTYGDPPGHTCMAVVGTVTMVRTLRTSSNDRVSNMWAFAEATLNLFVEALETAP
ncbi:damage-inducible protein [Polymorphobacter glacialis]|uniref:Damage-inducible protein n=1 Tax=Sandarakinorhabdus glacialis TaxID=1614636 RepID=A0A917EC31_9SPHN|nr:CinA family protein [Polymorphobacter glacialis]GGE22756.1 damage-inducible protein [Polymorphobacter glacialis]